MAGTGKSTGGRKGPRRTPRQAVLGGAVTAFVGATTTASGIAAVIADTGALAAGDYRVFGHFGADGVQAAGKAIEIAHRNAANNADVKTLTRCPCGASGRLEVPRITLAANERIVARAGSVAFAAGEQATASLEALAIPS